MYVYLNIVELSPVNNSQEHVMMFVPITSNFQEKGHLVCNPPLYVRVREKNIITITVKFLNKTG